MRLPADEVKPIVTRLKRANGHLASVIRMLEDGGDCEDVLTQFAAVTKAIDRGGYALVALAMQQCVAGGEDVDAARLEKLFLSLA